MKKSNYKVLIFYIALIAVILIATTAMFRNLNTSSVVYSDLVELFENEQVKSFKVDDNNVVTIITQDNKSIEYKLRDFSVFYYDFADIIKQQKADVPHRTSKTG